MPKFEKILSIDAELEGKLSNLMAISLSSLETIFLEDFTVFHHVGGFNESVQANINFGLVLIQLR